MMSFNGQPAIVWVRAAVHGSFVLLCLLAAATPTRAQEGETVARLVGYVTDIMAGSPAIAAEVVIVQLDRRSLSNEDGWFSIEGVQPGEYVVEVRYLGLTSAEYSVYLPLGTTRVDFEISAPPFQLEELVVEIRLHRTQKLLDFERRRQREKGYFIDRHDIERSAPVYISDLLRGIPSVRVEWTWEGNARLLMGHGISACEPDLYIDGSPSHAARINDWSPNLLEAIEVYNRAFDRPQQFRAHRCGAILLWTRERM